MTERSIRRFSRSARRRFDYRETYCTYRADAMHASVVASARTLLKAISQGIIAMRSLTPPACASTVADSIHPNHVSNSGALGTAHGGTNSGPSTAPLPLLCLLAPGPTPR